MTSLDLNADLGEGVGDDTAMLELVSSASIACGGHAGDAACIRSVLRQCKARGVRAGAHPGYPDRANFGRMRMAMPLDRLLENVREQVGLIRGIAMEEGVRVAYVKLHGALANQAAEDLPLATAVFGAVHEVDSNLGVLALDRSAQVPAAEAVGLRVELEAYADRAYQPDGLLVSRSAERAVLHDPGTIAERAVRLAQAGEIVAIDSTVLKLGARSLCIHGDTPDAVTIARRVRSELEAAGVEIRSPS
jgi:5-oxoprolinase (ATP-hydrolysing) subunit A